MPPATVFFELKYDFLGKVGGVFPTRITALLVLFTCFWCFYSPSDCKSDPKKGYKRCVCGRIIGDFWSKSENYKIEKSKKVDFLSFMP